MTTKMQKQCELKQTFLSICYKCKEENKAMAILYLTQFNFIYFSQS